MKVMKIKKFLFMKCFILGKINEIKKDSKILEKWFKC